MYIGCSPKKGVLILNNQDLGRGLATSPIDFEVWHDGKRLKLDARCLMAEKSRLCSKGGRDTWGPP